LLKRKWFREKACLTQSAVGAGQMKPGSRAVWSGMDAVSTPIASLLIAAGLVRTLGTEEYGLIVIALAISALSTAVNPAIAATTTKFVSASSGLGNSDKAIGRIITTSLVTVAVIDFILFAIAIAFGKPLSSLMFGQRIASGRPEISAVLLLAITSVCLQQIDSVFSASLKGLERFKQQAIMEICTRGSLVVAVVASGWISHDVRTVLLTYCCVCGASAIARACMVMSVAGERGVFVWPGAGDFVNLLRFGSWMWLNAIATIAYGTVDRILVGRTSGPSAAAEFSVYLQFAQLVHFVPASLFGFTFPVFSRLGANRARNMAEIRHLYLRYSVLAGGMGLSIAVGIAICMHGLLNTVGGGAFTHQHDLAFLLLVFGFLILSINVMPYYLALGIGSSRAVSLVTSASMVASIFLTGLLTPTFGLTGAAIARLAYGLGAMTLLFVAHRTLTRQ
jgi:O-antigen/teichoic acid export membrane protein